MRRGGEPRQCPTGDGEVDRASLTKQEFLGVFSDWTKRVEEHRQPKAMNANADAVSILSVVRVLTFGQAWGAVGAVGTVVSLVGAAAYWVGTKFPPTP